MSEVRKWVYKKQFEYQRYIFMASSLCHNPFIGIPLGNFNCVLLNINSNINYIKKNKMKRRFLAILISLFSTFTLTAQTKTPNPFSIGEIATIKSAILGENRTLNIYLPDGYNHKATYPVIYLLDGSANEDFLHVVGLVQFFNMTFKMPNTIIVGIANVDRRRDFTFPTKKADLKKAYPTTGGSAKFIDFIEKELQPYIKANYKTNDTTYLIGQSLGGLVATEILLKKPNLFTNYIIGIGV